MSAEDFAIVREALQSRFRDGWREALAALARIEARLAEAHAQVGSVDGIAEQRLIRAEAAERERDEFAEAMHQASLAVVRRRAVTEEKRA